MAPEGWRTDRLAIVLDAIDAGWSPQCESVPATGSQWGVLKVSAVTSGSYLPTENKALPASLSPRPDLEVRSGDVLLARANGVLELVGRTALVRTTPPRLMLSDKILRLRPIPGLADAAFLHALLSFGPTRDALASVTGGSHMRNVSQASLRDLVVTLPPLLEQRKIAAILSSVDDAIEATQAVIDQLGVVKKAMMAELLTRGLPGRHSRFKQTEIGELPEEWEMRSVAGIAAPMPFACVGGPFGSDLTSKHYSESGVPVIRGANLNGAGRWLVEDGFVYVSERKADELRRNLAFPGDIIFTQRGTLGQVARIRPDSRWRRFVLSQSQMKLTVDQALVDPDYVTLFFQSDAALAAVARATIATGIPHINLGILRAFAVPVPSLGEQQEVVAALAAVEDRVVAELGLLRQIRLLKSALMSVLLTGELRVTPDDGEAAA